MPRIETKLVSVDRSSPAIPAIAQGILLCSAEAEQRPKQRQSKPADLLPHKNLFDFSVSFRQCSGNALRIMQYRYTREANNRSFSVQTVKLEAPIPLSFSTGQDGQAAGSPCIVVIGHDRHANARALFALRLASVASAFSCLYIYRHRDLPEMFTEVAVSSKRNHALLHAVLHFHSRLDYRCFYGECGAKLCSRPLAVHAERFHILFDNGLLLVHVCCWYAAHNCLLLVNVCCWYAELCASGGLHI